MEAPPAPPAEPTHEEKMQSQLAAQLQLPSLDTSAAPQPQPVLHQASAGECFLEKYIVKIN